MKHNPKIIITIPKIPTTEDRAPEISCVMNEEYNNPNPNINTHNPIKIDTRSALKSGKNININPIKIERIDNILYDSNFFTSLMF